MRVRALVLLGMAAFFVLGFVAGNRLMPVRGQMQPGAGFAAVPGEKGGEDITGPYDVVANWPKPLSQLPGHENWTWGAVEGIFAESPNRVFIAQRGEEPLVKRPPQTPVPQFGPSLSFPTAEVPFRNASQGPVASLPGGGAPGDKPEDADKLWKGKAGVDARWEHNLVVVNSAGDIVESWTQWDSFFERPHAVYINPYDPAKNVWVVDDYKGVIFKFSNDGKQLLQTIGTPDKTGADETHFNRPTFLTWLPDSTMFVADGYNGTRVVKFDKNGKYLLAWGEKGNPPRTETRRATSTSSTASPPIRSRTAFTSAIAAIAASRCSTRTANSSTSGRSTNTPRSISCTSPPIATCGPRTTATPRSSSTISMATSCMPGARCRTIPGACSTPMA